MSNGKTSVPAPSVALYDFYKTNGTLSRDHAVMPGGPSLCRQEFAEECDINTIMKRYESTGASINGLTRQDAVPFYADFSEMPTDLLGYMSFMSQAEASFMSLPASVRREFDNSAIEFVAFASDPGNLEQMREWGLAPPAKPQERPPEAPKAQPVANPQGGPVAAPAASPGPSTHGST